MAGDFKMDAEHRMRDRRGNHVVFGKPTRKHAAYMRDGKRGRFNEKTGKVEYPDATAERTGPGDAS